MSTETPEATGTSGVTPMVSVSSATAYGTIVPTMRYRDVPAAIDWLRRAFGFEAHLVERDAAGTARYAQLGFGDGTVVIGPIDDVAYGLPGRSIEGPGTQICYVFAPDIPALVESAVAAGAHPIAEAEKPIGAGGMQSFRDPEGHVWNFGSYDPRRPRAVAAVAAGRTGLLGAAAEPVALLVGLIALGVALTAPLTWAYSAAGDLVAWSASEPEPKPQVAMRVAPVQETSSIDSTEAARTTLLLAQARAARAAADVATEEARASLAAAEIARRDALRDLLREQSARQAAELNLASAREDASRERTAREAAELATQQALNRKPKGWRLKRVENACW